MNSIFDDVKKIFNDNGYRLYMIGGTSRDYLLNKPIKDFDFVTDATPDDIVKFLKVDDTFKKYGTMKLNYNNIKIDITTLRIENDYKDLRHPNKIEFVKDINLDYLRRDLTINAIYIDENYEIIDPSNNGVNDLLKTKEIRFIGDPEQRIKEDPLRILRAERFAYEYDLKISDFLNGIFTKNRVLLKNISQGKLDEEKRKLEEIRKEKTHGK